MILTIINILFCLLGMVLGFYMLIRHLKVFNQDKTPVVDAWLVTIGTMAWSIWLLSSIEPMLQYQTLESSNIDLTGAEVFGNFLILVYWCGVLLQVKKYCFRLKLKKRKKQKESIHESAH